MDQKIGRQCNNKSDLLTLFGVVTRLVFIPATGFISQSLGTVYLNVEPAINIKKDFKKSDSNPKKAHFIEIFRLRRMNNNKQNKKFFFYTSSQPSWIIC